MTRRGLPRGPAWPQIRWFGRPWGAAVCVRSPHARTPIGEVCGASDSGECVAREEVIRVLDEGFQVACATSRGWETRSWHRVCFELYVSGRTVPA